MMRIHAVRREVLARWASAAARLVSLATIAATAGACSTDPMENPPPTASAKRPDAVDPNALLEGSESVFGLVLPRRSNIVEQGADRAIVDIPFSIESVSAYLRERVDTTNVEVGPRQTIFEGVTVKAAPGTAYQVILVRSSGATRLTFLKRHHANPDYKAPPKPSAKGPGPPPDLPKKVDDD